MNNSTTLAVKTDIFEGPMELLIELVEKRKLLINDISLATVTDEYIQTVSAMQELSLPNTAQFISLAATLLLIKSKSLLPILNLTDEEESNIDDLTERLKRYQLYRDSAVEIQSLFDNQCMYEPIFIPSREPLFSPDEFCTTDALKDAIYRVLTMLPRDNRKPLVKVKPTISLEDMILKLKTRIEKQIKTSFLDIKARETEHKNVIVGFLAILELFKQGDVLVTQSTRFDNIYLELKQTDTPRYY
jgi:segregation and condensation protein A